ncbi:MULTISPECIES: recombinase family protein [unclassified Inquilinus]|uniref:recombinase family protein n=1 Tax=unclassified Inquilinus TaxID=2645927 RepID=UPI003F910FFF
MEKIAAIYCRVSTLTQAGDDRISLHEQKAECLRQAKAEGYAVPAELVFEDAGVSGTKDEDERPAFGAMLTAARKGRFSRVYILRLDRLGRDQAITAGALKELARFKVECRSISEPDLSHPLLRSVLTGVAEYEHGLILTRTRRAKEAKRAEGKFISGQLPYGHRRGKGQTLELDPEEVVVLRRIYAEAIHGHGRIFIARMLNAENIIPPLVSIRVPGKERILRLRSNEIGGWHGLDEFLREHGAAVVRAPKWSEGTVTKLLSKTVNFGEVNGRPVVVNPSPAISRQTWERAIAASKGRVSRKDDKPGLKPRKPALLIGLLRCDCCRHTYTQHIGGRSRSVRSYVCLGKRRGKGECDNPNLSLEAANAYVIACVVPYLTRRLARDSFRAFLMAAGGRKIDDMQSALAAAQRALSELESERKALSGTIVDMRRLGLGEDDLEDFAVRIMEITPQISSRRREVEGLMDDLSRSRADLAADGDEADDAAEHAVDALWLVEGEDGDLTNPVPPREILRAVVKEVLVLKDKTLKIELDESDDALMRVVRLLSAASLDAVRKIDAAAALRKPVNIEGLEDELAPMLR